MPYCVHGRQERAVLGTPNRCPRCVVRDWNSRDILNGPLAHICACYMVIYMANLLASNICFKVYYILRNQRSKKWNSQYQCLHKTKNRDCIWLLGIRLKHTEFPIFNIFDLKKQNSTWETMELKLSEKRKDSKISKWKSPLNFHKLLAQMINYLRNFSYKI